MPPYAVAVAASRSSSTIGCHDNERHETRGCSYWHGTMGPTRLEQASCSAWPLAATGRRRDSTLCRYTWSVHAPQEQAHCLLPSSLPQATTGATAEATAGAMAADAGGVTTVLSIGVTAGAAAEATTGPTAEAWVGATPGAMGGTTGGAIAGVESPQRSGGGLTPGMRDGAQRPASAEANVGPIQQLLQRLTSRGPHGTANCTAAVHGLGTGGVASGPARGVAAGSGEGGGGAFRGGNGAGDAGRGLGEAEGGPSRAVGGHAELTCQLGARPYGTGRGMKGVGGVLVWEGGVGRPLLGAAQLAARQQAPDPLARSVERQEQLRSVWQWAVQQDALRSERLQSPPAQQAVQHHAARQHAAQQHAAQKAAQQHASQQRASQQQAAQQHAAQQHAAQLAGITGNDPISAHVPQQVRMGKRSPCQCCLRLLRICPDTVVILIPRDSNSLTVRKSKILYFHDSGFTVATIPLIRSRFWPSRLPKFANSRHSP